MKRIIALWLAALMLAAQPVQAAVCVGFGQNGSTPGWLETFDTASGYDSSGWTTVSGSPDPDSVTSPDPLTGSGQSLLIPIGDGVTSPNLGFSAASSWEFLINFDSVDNIAEQYIVTLNNSTGTVIARLTLRVDHTSRIYHGTALSASVTFAAGTTYHCWLDYTPSSGTGDGILRFYREAYTGSETKPGTPAASITTGTSTTYADQLSLMSPNTSGGGSTHYDNISGYLQ